MKKRVLVKWKKKISNFSNENRVTKMMMRTLRDYITLYTQSPRVLTFELSAPRNAKNRAHFFEKSEHRAITFVTFSKFVKHFLEF